MPQIISIAPAPFIQVMLSPNRKNEISSANIRAVPLNMNAVAKGILLMICCHRIAYNPSTSIHPHTFRIYPTLIKGCIAADFEKMPEHA